MDERPEIQYCRNPAGGGDLINPPSRFEGKRLASLTSSPRYGAGTPRGFNQCHIKDNGVLWFFYPSTGIIGRANL